MNEHGLGWQKTGLHFNKVFSCWRGQTVQIRLPSLDFHDDTVRDIKGCAAGHGVVGGDSRKA
jgi:hypothetical protein